MKTVCCLFLFLFLSPIANAETKSNHEKGSKIRYLAETTASTAQPSAKGVRAFVCKALDIAKLTVKQKGEERALKSLSFAVVVGTPISAERAFGELRVGLTKGPPLAPRGFYLGVDENESDTSYWAENLTLTIPTINTAHEDGPGPGTLVVRDINNTQPFRVRCTYVPDGGIIPVDH